MPCDWPAEESEALWGKLQRLREKYDPDIVAETLLAAFQHPFDDVQAKGGAWRYTLGILKHKRVDAQRAQKREQEHLGDLALLERVQTDGQVSRMLSRGADEFEPSGKSELAPPQARNSSAALAECNCLLGEELCRTALVHLKQVLRRQGYLSEAPKRLQPFVALSPALNVLRKAREEHSGISTDGMNGAEDRLTGALSPSRLETLDDVWDVPQLVKAVNLRRELEAWIQSEQPEKWISDGMKFMAEAQHLLAEVRTTEIEAVARYFVSIEPKKDRRVFTPATAALLEIAAGLELPPDSKSAWKTRCGRWKKAFHRARAEDVKGDNLAEKTTLVPP